MDDKLKKLWDVVRALSGDDNYERYLVHQHETHPDQPVLDRRAFFSINLENKWSGIARCC
ncbi:MAG: YbdD/YjiX family protein [Burkholderiales bacterium]